MQREIKFRVFDKELKEYRTPQGGDYSLGVLSGKVRGKYGEEFPEMIVEQYTGLKDKNGKEIYEGDLLLDTFPIDDEDLSKGYHEDFLPVVWCSKKLQWCVDVSFAKDGSYLTSLVEYFGEFLEVKGNVYENPEMINYIIFNEFTRLEAACRRFKFEVAKSFGIFWLIEKIPWLKIKEPWNKLYKRSLRK